jgi:hypothetical protein
MGGGMGGDEPGIGTGRVVTDENPVEPRRFVGTGEITYEVRIDRGLDRQSDGTVDLGDIVGPDHADELNVMPVSVSRLDNVTSDREMCARRCFVTRSVPVLHPSNPGMELRGEHEPESDVGHVVGLRHRP